MSNTEDISVTAVVTTYDRPQLVRRAIRSVLAQTYMPLEIVVVEDGTDSGVEAWINQENHDVIEYFCHDENNGLAAARNTGLELASSKYVAYLDDDDEWKADRIEKQIQLLSDLSRSQRDKVGVLYSRHETRYPNETVVSDAGPYNSGSLRDSIIQQRKLTTPPSSFLFRKSALETAGGFDEQLPSSIDHDIWMALANAGYHAYYVDEPLVYNSKEGHDNMVTNTEPRIRGVLQFVEKWRAVFKEWMGDRRGDEFVDRYVAQVLGQLSGEKAQAGEWREVLDVSLRSFKHLRTNAYNARIQTDRICRGVARRFLPRSARKRIKTILNGS